MHLVPASRGEIAKSLPPPSTTMAASAKTIIDFFKEPSAKRVKRLASSPPAAVTATVSKLSAVFSSSSSASSASATADGENRSPNEAARSEAPHSISATNDDLTAEQKSRMEFNKAVARAKRNLKLCSVKLSKCGSVGHVKLEELLVEESWLQKLPGEFEKPYAKNLFKFVETEIQNGDVPVYPPQHLIFNALNTTSFDLVKVVIIGQDPYHGPGQAMGLSFSVPEGVKVPSSLVNIYKELQQDVGCSIPKHGNLERWALQGVLLLNAVLTVKQNQANSHAKKGWEQFTDAVIKTISKEKCGVVFLLWGNYAQAKARLIDETKHCVLKSAHPSGLSANRGFFGCRHFSKTNQILEKMGVSPIDWQL